MQLIAVGFAPDLNIPDDYQQVNYTLTGQEDNNVIFVHPNAPEQFRN
jgi:hypothetical protein